jgi:Zn-finger nucleic acid-binding protein
MECPYCNHDLSEHRNFDAIYEWHTCPNCNNQVWLDYEEWGIWIFLTEKNTKL